VHGAGATLGDAAPIFWASHADPFPQYPQQRGVRIGIDLMSPSVNGEISHLRTSVHRCREEARLDTAINPSVMPSPVFLNSDQAAAFFGSVAHTERSQATQSDKK
jgi:hypothetical protein